MTTLQWIVTIMQSITQLWAAAAYAVAFIRTSQRRYLVLALAQVALLGSIMILLWGFGMVAVGALFLAVSLWSLFTVLTNRSDPIHYPGYASARDVFTFRSPLLGRARRDG